MAAWTAALSNGEMKIFGKNFMKNRRFRFVNDRDGTIVNNYLKATGMYDDRQNYAYGSAVITLNCNEKRNSHEY